ncbi:hypothetical protein ABH924_001795 [Arthrobacter sp. GAS37]
MTYATDVHPTPVKNARLKLSSQASGVTFNCFLIWLDSSQ